MTNLIKASGEKLTPTPEQMFSRAQQMAAGMLDNAKSRVAAQKDTADFYSPDEAPDVDPSRLIQPMGWNLLVRPLSPPEKIGNVHIADETRELVEYTTCVARVISIGPLAWNRPDMQGGNYPEIGQYVTYPRYAGLKYVIDGIKYLMLVDEDVKAIVPAPDAVKRM